MNFKRIFLGLFAALCLAESASAAPADQRPRKVRQADGTYMTVIKRGDEFGHVTMTTDGYPLFYNESIRRHHYSSLMVALSTAFYARLSIQWFVKI